ncbi:PHP domain-containing protein [Lachnospiraceae bacterium ZAX-1]
MTDNNLHIKKVETHAYTKSAIGYDTLEADTIKIKKVETHAHTKGASPCAKVPVYETVKIYANAGYGALIITNHFNWDTVESVPKYIDYFKRAKEAGDKLGIEVWFGIETCIAGGPDDFLLYGVDSDILYENPQMYKMTQKELFRECEQYHCLMYQAHPCRSYCQPRDPFLIHGVEVYNANIAHEEHNDEALAWALKYNLLQSSGSDFHRPIDAAKGGILVPESIHSVHALANYMRVHEVTLIRQAK